MLHYSDAKGTSNSIDVGQVELLNHHMPNVHVACVFD